MPPKADKLTQSLQSLQLLLQRKIEQYREFEPIIRQLQQLETILNTKKLILQIVSSQDILAQALFDFLQSYSHLKDAYDIKFDSLPYIPETLTEITQTTLSVQCILEQTTALEQSYILSPDQEIIIGRNPDANIELDHPQYRGISWNHAIIKPVINDHQITWEIQDLNSTNGTYVNGNLLTDKYILQSGDVITLASSQKSYGIVELIFNIQKINAEMTSNDPYYDIINCDLLLLVTNDTYWSELEKNFVQKGDFHLINKCLLIPELTSLEEDFTALTSELFSLDISSKFEIVPVFLKPYYDDSEIHKSVTLDRALQKKQDQFLKIIETLIKRQPENILAARLADQVSILLQPIQTLLIEEKQNLTEEINQYKQELDNLDQNNYKELTKKALSKANEDKEQFFKKVKLEINQSKAIILDTFSKKSIIYQIQEFAESLQPIITKREGNAYIKLASLDNTIRDNINNALRSFCLSWIEKWADGEWEKTVKWYSDGGINGLIERLKTHLNIIPALMYKTSFSDPHSVNVKSSLMMSFAEINSEIRYKQISMLSYLMKEIRTNIMQYMMMLTLLLALVGIKGGKNQFFQWLSHWFKTYPWLLGLIVFIILYVLMSAYRSDTQAKLEEVSDKLRKEVSGYYQSLSKNLLEKIIQEFTIALDYESQKIDDTLSSFQINYNDYITEVEKQKIRLQANLEFYQEKEKNLDKEIAELKKLQNF